MRAVLRRLAAPTVFFTLAACGGSDVNTPAPTPEESLTPVEVTVADEFAKLPAPATGVAFWTHSTLPFNSLVLTASSDGVVAYNMEDGAEVARMDNIDAAGIALAYRGRGPAAKGVTAIYDRANGRFVFKTIDNIKRSFASGYASLAVNAPVNGFCFGRAADADALRLYVLRDRRLAVYGFAENAPAGKARETVGAPKGTSSCAVDDIDGSVFVATTKGEIYRYTEGEKFGSTFAAARTENAVSIGVALNGLVVGGPTDQCCGQIALLDGADGAIHLFDRDDGSPIGVFRIKASDEIAGVASATAMAVGYGNYGGLYRNGAMALATDGDAPALRLTAYNGVANALGLTLGDPADPRGSPQEDERVIDIELVKP